MQTPHKPHGMVMQRVKALPKARAFWISLPIPTVLPGEAVPCRERALQLILTESQRALNPFILTSMVALVD